MALLSGLNYDYTGQQTTKITAQIGTGSITLKVENSEGFNVDDYIVIDPKNEKSEILRIATIPDNLTITISASKFKHELNASLYRIPYNQMRFYSSTDVAGTYSLIAAGTSEMAYAGLYTNFEYTAGSASLYYKRTFYNSSTTTESDIAEADYWQTGDESLYVNAEELRVFLQFDQNDYPNPEDMTSIIKIAQRKIALDVDSSNQEILFLSTLMLSKAFVLRALATRSLSKGYITINVEGRNVTKAYQELVLDAENVEKEYEIFIRNNTRTETSKTNFMDDTTIVSPETRRNFIRTLAGTSNAQNDTRANYWNRRTR